MTAATALSLPTWEGVELENSATWPAPVTELFTASLDLIRAYETEQARIDALEPQWMTGQPIPVNHHRRARDRIVEQVSAILQPESVISYHCARLHADEIAAIRANGMVPLSVERLATRIQRRIDAGDIPEIPGRQLLEKHGAASPTRNGKLWFFRTRSTLQDEIGLHLLFRYWGGEALYHLHETDTEIEPILRGIGEPSIVVAAVPLDQFALSAAAGERFYAAFISAHGMCGDEHQFSGYVKCPVQAPQIRDIVCYADPRFEHLTRASSWQPHHWTTRPEPQRRTRGAHDGRALGIGPLLALSPEELGHTLLEVIEARSKLRDAPAFAAHDLLGSLLYHDARYPRERLREIPTAVLEACCSLDPAG